MAEPKLTLGERLEIFRLEALGLKRAAAGITEQPDIDRRVNRVREKARKRANGNK